MNWYDEIIEKMHSDTEIVNDAKTPSGRVHVGSLRGVIIHDCINKIAKYKGKNSKFLYDIDEFDPMDGLPSDATEELKQHMGKPLFMIPAPAGSPHPDIATHYASEFLGVINELGVEMEVIKARDFYKNGLMNESIDTLLRSADEIRKIYYEVNKSERDPNWHPFQTVCENCGKIGTTVVNSYDGKEVEYECRPNLVKWATGCGYKGKVSPFDGTGKLPWKAEWPAKWNAFGITLEGAGKDHSTKGGSRDVADLIMKRVFKKEPPINVPYEFFLVNGSKMSSSKGIGSSSREIADFLPPEILRFLMINTPPKRAVNFTTDFDYMVKLFNDYDRKLESYLKTPTEEAKVFLQLLEKNIPTSVPQGFQLITALLSMPHIDLASKFGDTTTKLERRIKSVKYWLDNFATTEEKLTINTQLPDISDETERKFLSNLKELLEKDTENTEISYQNCLFSATKLTGLEGNSGFKIFYKALLNKESGPKGGNIIYYLGKEYILNLLKSI